MIGEKLYVKVKKFYRPENTQRWETLSRSSDINKLYWSDEGNAKSYDFKGIQFQFQSKSKLYCYLFQNLRLSLVTSFGNAMWRMKKT